MTPPKFERIRTLLRHPLLLPLYFVSFLTMVSSSMLIPVLPLYAREYSGSYGLVGLVLSGVALGRLLGDLPAGMVLHQMGIKRTMQVGIFFSMIASFAPFWAQSAYELLAYQVVNGFSFALYNVARHAFLAEFIVTGKRGKSIAALGGVFRISRFIAPAIGGGIASWLGLRAPFLLSGILVGASLIVINATLHLPETTPGDSAATGRFGARLMKTLKMHYRSLLTGGLGHVTLQLIRNGRSVIVPLYASDMLGLGVGVIGWIESLASAVDMLLFYPAGWIMDRKGRKYAIIPSALLISFGLALIPLTTGFGSLLGASLLIGFGNGLGSGAMLTLGADLSPPDLRGEYLGFWQLLGDGGAMSCPLIIGGVADLFVLPVAAWVVCGIGIGSALIFLFFVPETNRARALNG